MIHSEHPFVPGDADRDPLRRFRGRHASGVSIVTSGTERVPAGLTVSSLMVLEGDPALIVAVVGPLSDLWDAIETSGGFVVHLCRQEHRDLSDVFAGIRPSPGGVFARLHWEPSEWGPVLVDLPDRAFCRVLKTEELGYTGMVVGTIDRVEVANLTDPLIYFRGGYRGLS